MHELNYIWINYFWASLKGNGPEAVVQTIVYALIAYTFIPPFRRFINGHFKATKELAQAHHDERMSQAESHHSAAIALARAHHKARMGGDKPVAPHRDATGRFAPTNKEKK